MHDNRSDIQEQKRKYVILRTSPESRRLLAMLKIREGLEELEELERVAEADLLAEKGLEKL